MSLRLNDLDYFLAVADAGQVRRPDALLGVSQPAPTKGIQRLAHALGFALFERSPRGMAHTTVARAFHDPTAPLHGTLADAIRHRAVKPFDATLDRLIAR